MTFLVFHSCKLRGDIEIDGQKVRETTVDAYVQERSSDRPPWGPNEPWKIGVLDADYRGLSLYLSPVAFQQLWEMADARENEWLEMDIRDKSAPMVASLYSTTG